MPEFRYSLVQIDIVNHRLLRVTWLGAESEIPDGWAIAQRSPCLARRATHAIP